MYISLPCGHIGLLCERGTACLLMAQAKLLATKEKKSTLTTNGKISTIFYYCKLSVLVCRSVELAFFAKSL